MAAAPIKSEIFKFSANGGAKVTVGFESLDLELKITGNYVGHFSGYAKYMTLSATEKSKVDARPIECVSADVEAATGAEAYVTISERLVANAKSTSSIFYRGTPVIIKDMTSKMSSGMIGSGLHYIGVKE